MLHKFREIMFYLRNMEQIKNDRLTQIKSTKHIISEISTKAEGKCNNIMVSFLTYIIVKGLNEQEEVLKLDILDTISVLNDNINKNKEMYDRLEKIRYDTDNICDNLIKFMTTLNV